MNETEIEMVRAELQRLTPVTIVPFNGDVEGRTIRVPVGRKRWNAVLQVLARTQWSRLELLDRSGSPVGVVDLPSASSQPAPQIHGQVTLSGSELLRLLIAGQKEALSHRERETSEALGAMVRVMAVVTQSIQTLAQTHQMSLRAHAEAMAAVQSAPDADSNDLQSTEMVKALMPVIVGRLMSQPAPTPATPPNGEKR